MSQFAYDVTLENFEATVLQPSLEVPVLVDFWADWCQPCQTLTPILTKLADEFGGRFLLAKVNADLCQELAQHFGIRSLPTVKVLVGGRIVDEFTGAKTESEVRAFIERLLPAPGADLRAEAAQLREAGDLDGALALLAEASQLTPGDEAIRLDAADILIELARNDEAEHLLAAEYSKEASRAQALRTRLALAAKAVDTSAFETRLATNPDDHAARLELAQALAGGGRYREALDAAMEVVRRDRFFNQGAARAAMLQIFEALAGDERHDDLVREFRRALSAALN